jgi:glycosyltransferase involved in cell wall biosynthesis
MFPFSVTMSVYKNDSPAFFSLAMNSLINQTIQPNEIVLTVDGPVPDSLIDTVKFYQKTKKNIKAIYIEKNVGLGIAHRIGVENCSYELVAIMDSDDISVLDRFEKQLRYFHEDKNLDILSGYICEFVGDVKNVIGLRTVPLTDNDIKKYIKRRCPLNHVAVMFKKSSVLRCGNYQDWSFNEDYYLWCRMFLASCKFGNIPVVLCYVRCGNDMYKRRGGLKYFNSEFRLQKFMLNKHIINYYEYIRNMFFRFVVQIMVPYNIRGFLFRKLFRKNMGRGNKYYKKIYHEKIY